MGEPTVRPDLCEVFAGHAVNTSFLNLQHSAVEGAKKSILDTYGVMLAASGVEPAVGTVIDFVKESGGRPESTIIGFGGKVPAAMAAFANGVMAHSLDFDDQTPWGQHSGSSIVPAALAVAERLGGVSGQRLIAAVAIGQDLFNRTRRNVDWRKDWMFTTVMGVFSATAACCHLLELSREQTVHAFGIALMQCCGSAEVVNSTGGNLRAMYAGFPAKGAVMAALLAQRGVTGVPGVFEGPFGVMNLYFGGRYDREAIVDGLGDEYTGGLTLYKRWPAVGTAHSHVHATVQLMQEHALTREDLSALHIHVGDYHRLMCEPSDQRRRPSTPADAKFSLPYVVAVAAIKGDVGLADFKSDALTDPAVLELCGSIRLIPDANLDWKLELPAGKVVIVTRDGRRLEKTGVDIPGSLENPMTWTDLFRKFDDCDAASVSPRSQTRLEGIHQFVMSMEAQSDAVSLLGL